MVLGKALPLSCPNCLTSQMGITVALHHAYLVSHFSGVRLCATPWTAACQAPLFMGFSRKEYSSGLPCPPPGDLPNPGIEHRSPELWVDSLPGELPGKPVRKTKLTPS